MAKFLETITAFDNDALVPIDRIKYVNTSSNNEYCIIRIEGDDGNWEEFFPHQQKDRFETRYKMIKKIIKAE